MSDNLPAVVFFGSGAIGLPSFRAVCEADGFRVAAAVTQPDRPAGRGLQMRMSPIKLEALARGIPVLQPERLRQPEGDACFDALAAMKPDFFVVFAYGQIFPRRFLDLPRTACVNLHASLLPRHRGAAPIHSAILAGDRESGVALMHMSPGLDEGDVISECRTVIGKRETSGSLHDRLALLAPDLLLDGLRALAEGRAARVPQDPSLATYAPKLDRASGQIRWQEDAASIDRLIRAMHPWPGAWTLLESRRGPTRLKIHAASRIAGNVRREAKPGTVLGWDARGIKVAAGRGIVLLRELQQEGRKRLPAGAFAAGWGGNPPGAFFTEG